MIAQIKITITKIRYPLDDHETKFLWNAILIQCWFELQLIHSEKKMMHRIESSPCDISTLNFVPLLRIGFEFALYQNESRGTRIADPNGHGP
jgi:hypothetical protein